MKTTLLFSFSLLFINALNAQQKVVVKDSFFTAADTGKVLQLQGVNTSIYNTDCRLKIYSSAIVDAFTNQLKDQYQLVYDYYPNGTVHYKTIQTKFGSDTMYKNNTREVYTYTAANMIATDLYESWDGSAWRAAYLTKNTYDETVRITEIVNQSTDGSSPLRNLTQALTVYDTNGNIIKEEDLDWDTTSNAWIPKDETLFTYDATGYVATKANKLWGANLNTWTLIDSSTYYNNSKGLPDSVFIQTSDTTFSKGYYTYIPVTSMLYQFNNYNYKNGERISGYRATYFHDSVNYVNTDSTVNEIYQPIDSSFAISFYTVYTKIYNTDSTLKEFIAVAAFPPYQQYNYTKNSYTYAPCSSVLPVIVISFTGEQQNNNIMLHWQTANDINSAHFLVQRSTDGMNFTTIGNVQVSGSNSIQKDYSYTDTNISTLATAKLYYRLVAVNHDGSRVYSKIVPIHVIADRFHIAVSPNPFTNTILVYVPATPQHIKFTISDISGKIVYTAAPRILSGKLTIDAAKFAKGIYLLIIQSAENRQVLKIVKH